MTCPDANFVCANTHRYINSSSLTSHWKMLAAAGKLGAKF